MASAERVSNHRWAASDIPAPNGPAVMDTSEVRWFASGPVPHDVLAWFAGMSTITLIDERTDRYLGCGIRDLGVKYRALRVLEVKRRHSSEGAVTLEPGLTAELVRWQKWRPAEFDAAWLGADSGYIDVRKVVLKSSLISNGGVFVPGDTQSNLASAACNVELASVAVDGVAAWTIGLEASGPVELRRTILIDAWRAACERSLSELRLGSRFEIAAAYPGWLDQQQSFELAG